MIRRTFRILATAIAATSCSGCLVSGPTAAARIEATPISNAKYRNLGCPQLQQALEPLWLQERQLSARQDLIVEHSQSRSGWFTPPEHDGQPAHELADTRGEINAAQSVIEAKGCKLKAD